MTWNAIMSLLSRLGANQDARNFAAGYTSPDPAAEGRNPLQYLNPWHGRSQAMQTGKQTAAVQSHPQRPLWEATWLPNATVMEKTFANEPWLGPVLTQMLERLKQNDPWGALGIASRTGGVIPYLLGQGRSPIPTHPYDPYPYTKSGRRLPTWAAGPGSPPPQPPVPAPDPWGEGAYGAQRWPEPRHFPGWPGLPSK